VQDKPLKSVTHGQCDATPTVTFPGAGHYRPLTVGKLYFGDSDTTCPSLLPEAERLETNSHITAPPISGVVVLLAIFDHKSAIR